MLRTYEEATTILNTRIRGNRPSLKVAGAPAGRMGLPSTAGMDKALRELGYSVQDINQLNIIHIAGSKGKGSTCALVQSLLTEFGRRAGDPRKVGLFTSPHLCSMTERIRIDGIPLSQEKFAQNFFEVYDKISGDLRFTQLLALVAFHTFHKERVGAAVIETSVGGEYDATNVIQKPVVTGVTSIGIDHVDTLGSELGQIAWHKGGIFKSGVPAFSICQGSAAKAALLARAAEKGADLQFVGLDPRLPDSPNLEMQAQRLNYSLAIATVHAYIKLKAPEESLTSTDILKGVNNVNFPGRFQLISEGNFKWHLDVAHNEMSMKVAAEWFAIRASKPERKLPRVLIFRRPFEPQKRNSLEIVRILSQTLCDQGVSIEHAIFTELDQDHETRDNITQESLYSEQWKQNQPKSQSYHEICAEHAIKQARAIGEKSGGMYALITGNTTLVGEALSFLGYDFHSGVSR